MILSIATVNANSPLASFGVSVGGMAVGYAVADNMVLILILSNDIENK
jgi:hypothetical protein